jgi:hypothetical protein
MCRICYAYHYQKYRWESTIKMKFSSEKYWLDKISPNPSSNPVWGAKPEKVKAG